MLIVRDEMPLGRGRGGRSEVILLRSWWVVLGDRKGDKWWCYPQVFSMNLRSFSIIHGIEILLVHIKFHMWKSYCTMVSFNLVVVFGTVYPRETGRTNFCITVCWPSGTSISAGHDKGLSRRNKTHQFHSRYTAMDCWRVHRDTWSIAVLQQL